MHDEPLFQRWIATYPESVRAGFQRDGIVDEELYWSQPRRVVFVLLEPNSTGGRYDRFYGVDLREVFRKPLNKEMTKNVALWTRYLLDGVARFDRMDVVAACEQIRRVAVANLKKIPGGGKADYVAVGQHAWRDRAFLREQMALLRPQLIVTCGEVANRLFGQVALDDEYATVPWDRTWEWGEIVVLPANHPSLRAPRAESAFKRLVARHQGSPTTESTSLDQPRAELVPRKIPFVPVPPVRGRQAWILRPYPHHRFRLPHFLAGDFIAIGWPGIGDIGGLEPHTVLTRLSEAYPERASAVRSHWLPTILRFRDELHEGDLVVVTPKMTDSPTVAIAEVVGPYVYRGDLDGEGEAYPHTRSVRWLSRSMPRSEMPERVTRSMAQGTLNRTDSDALARWLASAGLLS